MIALAVLGGGSYALYRSFKYAKEDVPAAVDIQEVAEENREQETSILQSETEEKKVARSSITTQEKSSTSQTNQTKGPVATSLPSGLNLAMPFYTQAPFSNWDYPWQEACEEATTLLIANVYAKHNWTREQFNDEILKLVEWEKQYFGDYKHTTVAQTVEFLDKYFGLKTVVHQNPTFEDVQKILAKGHLIAMPFAGKMLGNPNYKNGGPIYHMMVIKGYKSGQKIITNDVGTRNGENYVYTWDTIKNALHDYAEPIQNGAKSLIEVLPPS